MKANAIARIVIYSLLILIFAGILLAGIGIGSLTFHIDSGSGTVVKNEASVNAENVKNLEIDWAAGSIRIETADTDIITFRESADGDIEHPMTYQVTGNTLKLDYRTTGIVIGWISTPNKDLIITVPHGWICKKMEIDGASLSIDISGIIVDTMDLDGASNDLEFSGSLAEADIDGASNSVTLVCANRPSRIDLDGASCDLNLTIPKGCGFTVQMDGLSCDFHSDLNCTGSGGNYHYGDRYCKINADGISCDITVNESE